MEFRRKLRRRLYFLWVTLSIVTCAVVFLPWFLPRETTSGLMGRWYMTETGRKHGFACWLAPWLDRLFHGPMKVETCVEVYRLEQAAREATYLRGELG
jgi:hypothetical protein